MAEANSEIPLSGDPRVDAALQRIRGKFQDLEDAMLVQAHLEKRMSERIVEHARFAAKHEEWLQHIEWKLDALTDIIMRREGGPEAQL